MPWFIQLPQPSRKYQLERTSLSSSPSLFFHDSTILPTLTSSYPQVPRAFILVTQTLLVSEPSGTLSSFRGTIIYRCTPLRSLATPKSYLLPPPFLHLSVHRHHIDQKFILLPSSAKPTQKIGLGQPALPSPFQELLQLALDCEQRQEAASCCSYLSAVSHERERHEPFRVLYITVSLSIHRLLHLVLFSLRSSPSTFFIDSELLYC